MRAQERLGRARHLAAKSERVYKAVSPKATVVDADANLAGAAARPELGATAC